MGEKIGKILVFIEGTDISAVTAQYAIALAKKWEAELTAMYVIDMKTLNELLKARVFVQTEEADFEQDLERDGKHYLAEVQEMAEAKGVRINTVLIKGEIHAEVTKKVEELGIDLLVLEEIEVPESRRDFYYNETERIFREVKCPVLVVKETEKISQIYDSL